jgi:preprotein translocase subunit SecF
MRVESTTVSRLVVTVVVVVVVVVIVVVWRGKNVPANIANMALLAAIKSGHENHGIG